MIKRLNLFIRSSFRRKLVLFTLSAVFITTIVLFVFLMNNFRGITEFSLAQNSHSMETTVEDYLNKYAAEKAISTWLQIKAAMDNLSVLGKTAQTMIDNKALLAANDPIFSLPGFRTPLRTVRGALTSPNEDAVNTLIPPSLAASAEARETLKISAMLNMVLGPVFEANNNNAFVYFVGNPPVTRAFPNIDLVEALGDGVNLLFWKDYFAENVAGWTKWFRDDRLRQSFPSPVTVEAPYADAAGQGMMVTMFYPLWDKAKDRFAGAVGADITLAKIIENVLELRVAKTGFAFLMNGKGEIIAMPETGFKLFRVDLKETKQGGLAYYSGSLSSSHSPDVQAMGKTILANDHGLLKLALRNESGVSGELVVYASLPALTSNSYEKDIWKIVIAVPEAEIFESLNITHSAIASESLSMSLVSIVIMIAFLGIVTVIALKYSTRATRDLLQLAQAAGQISAKNYNYELKLHSRDEIGLLGNAFLAMSREIREHTEHLEARVDQRTAELSHANKEITRLNDQLKGENLRLGAELDVARRLQSMVLPGEKEANSVPGLDIACYMRPADEVGGDYYDVQRMGDYTYIGIGDVTGHGLPSGVVMLMAQTALLTLTQSGETDMKRMLDVMNTVLFKNIVRIHEDKNMTLAVLQYYKGEFVLVGQHESVIICRVDGSIEVIDTMDLGLPIGLDEQIAAFIATKPIHLQAGDTMVLYTDGVTEAENSLCNQLGIEGLSALIARYHDDDAKTMLDQLVSDIYSYIGAGRIWDDISLMVIRKGADDAF